jgi:parallel beta-helix repeat protein
MKKKLLMMSICLALLVLVLPAAPVLAATTWYVDDDPGADFTTIQAAIDAASAGDTIIVKDGTYVENVTVDKSLIIQSENGSATTFVQSVSTTPDVFYVTASGVTIDGFTASGATSMGKSGIHIYGPASGSCTIINNECTGNSQGISVDSLTSGNTISGNTCTANGRYGIYLSNTTGNTVTGNTCSNNTSGSGFALYLADNADNNTVTGNTSDSNVIGIRVKAADSNTIFKNTSSNNAKGIEIATGAVGNVFYLNNFIGNTANISVGVGAVAGNFWDSPAPIEYWFDGTFYTGYMGNYWDDYAGTDADSDGIGDTPYTTFTTECDNYPLMGEYEPYFQVPPPDTSASLTATTNLVMPVVGIDVDPSSIDYGDIAPGESSGVETVGITNTGNLDCDVTLEVDGADDTAQDFYEQSLYIDGGPYDIATVIASIEVGDSQDVDTQLQVPLSWAEAGAQEATFIFWAEASP